MENTATHDVLGPPPSYDSVMYGDAASAPPSSNIHPLPAQYPNPYSTYPVPPSYPGAPSPSPYLVAPYNTSQPTGTAIVQPTIVCANQQPQTATSGCRRAIIIIVCAVFFFIIVIIAWNLSLH